MIFKECQLKDVRLILQEPVKDERGFFSRTFCKKAFEEQGIDFEAVQCNLSYNEKKGTLRGLHFQRKPFEEGKLVNCISGSIFDVIVDLRRESETYLQWESFLLSKKNRRILYIPKGFAHGFQTLEDHTEVFYQMNAFYHPECAEGIRWDDPQFGIEWPEVSKRIISEKDRNYKGFVG